MLQEKRCKQCLCTHKHEKSPESLLQFGCVFLLVEAPAPTPRRTRMFWVTILSGSAARLKNRLGEQFRSQKVYNKNRKSRDNTTVNFDRLTWDVPIDRMYSNIISKMGFQKFFLRKSPILAPMSRNWYTDHAPAVWHF